MEFTPLYRPQANGIVERQHSALKNSLKATLMDMGDKYGEKWHDALPWVLMGRRAAFIEEMGSSPFQMVFNQSPILPGAIVDDPGPPLNKEQLQSLLRGLESQVNVAATPTIRHGQSDYKTYTKGIDSATHVYLRADNPQGLQSRYHGPYLIKRRIGDSTIEVRTGTYKNGSERLEIHSWNNAKPANLADNMEAAERPKLGRPTKIVADADTPPLASEADSLLTPSSKNADKPVSKQPKTPTHNMTLRARNK